MSVKAMGEAWDSPYSGGQLLVLLALTDVANDANENLFWMTVAALAKKAKVSANTARSALQTFVGDGWLEVVTESKGRKPTEYRYLGQPSSELGVEPTLQSEEGEPSNQKISTLQSDDPSPITNSREPKENDNGRVFTDAQLAEGQVALDAGLLCRLLADRIEENGSKRPTVTKRWLDAARLMMIKDGRTAESIAGAINWSQKDEFWRANILSMPKLREKFDTLRLQAQRKPRAGRDLTSRRKEKTDRLAELHEERERRNANANQKGLPA